MGQGGGGFDVVVPWRNVRSFQETYPIEQFHSETYGNLYLDAVAKEALRGMGAELPRVQGVGEKGRREGLDWHFGPFAFRAKHLNLWTECTGEMYDAQLVPIVHAMRKGLSITSIQVDYHGPLQMKAEEEGNITFIEKRLWQLNDLDPRVKKAWSEEFYC
uniref:Uncharacterized protein n=1 Tax=Trieres chinensis TaxID=1514140 RepID=A0A7S1ZEB3_TRICV